MSPVRRAMRATLGLAALDVAVALGLGGVVERIAGEPFATRRAATFVSVLLEGDAERGLHVVLATAALLGPLALLEPALSFAWASSHVPPEHRRRSLGSGALSVLLVRLAQLTMLAALAIPLVLLALLVHALGAHDVVVHDLLWLGLASLYALGVAGVSAAGWVSTLALVAGHTPVECARRARVGFRPTVVFARVLVAAVSGFAAVLAVQHATSPARALVGTVLAAALARPAGSTFLGRLVAAATD